MARLPLLAVVEVSCLSDVEALAVHGGPRRIVLLGADSVSHARAMLSVLREKGLLLKKGSGVAKPRGKRHGDGDIEGAQVEGSDLGDAGWRGWVVEQQDPEEDLDVVISDLLSDVDSDEGGRVKGAQQDVVADGWVVENLREFRRAVDLGLILEEVVGEIIPLLVKDPTDSAASATAASRFVSSGRRCPG